MGTGLKHVVLSALLHDIGKFAQRARRPYSESMAGEYLTYFKGKQGHWHSLYTDYFIENDLPLPEGLERDRSMIARTASAHHRPNESSLAEMAINIADRLSSGTDRISDTDTEKLGFRKARLVSVFDEVELGGHVFKSPGKAFYKLAALDVGSEDIFPILDASKGPDEDYQHLFEEFLKGMSGLQTEVFHIYLGGLITLLEKYSWSIPSSSYKTLPDVSLFDHAQSTAAIAQALFCHHKMVGGVPKWRDEQEKFILLGGDYSGIQDYIFNISKNSGRGVSKIFRARSFYLQALQRSILIDLHRRLDMLPVSQIIDSGGKFIFLLPLGGDIENRLGSFETEIQQWFRNEFKGRLTLNLSWSVRMRQQDFIIPKIQNRIDNVNDALNASKLRKLSKTFKSEGALISNDYDAHEGSKCSLCLVNKADPEAGASYENKMGVSTTICASCFQQIDYIGEELPKTSCIGYGEKGVVPLFADISMTLLKKIPSRSEFIHIDTLDENILSHRLRIAKHLPVVSEAELADIKLFDLFSKETGQTPEPGEIKTFNMIAQKAKKKYGEKRVGRALLGFMKADVDNLGLIFSLGLGERMSIARYMTLSRMLNLFFSDYLVSLIQKKYSDIYVVFAGGDDLFLVGPLWDILNFSVDLRKKFTRFCADNKDFTISAGILNGKPRLPMRKAAEMVEECLEDAKLVDEDTRSKDSVGFLGETFSWDELKSLLSRGAEFDRAVENKKDTNFTTAFLYRLYTYFRMYRKFKSGNQIHYGRYLSLAHYDIGRNLVGKGYANQKEIEMLYQIFSVGVSQRPELDRLNVPLFYAINRNRETN